MNYVLVLLAISLVGCVIGRSGAVLCNGTCTIVGNTSGTPLQPFNCKVVGTLMFALFDYDSGPTPICSGVACVWTKITPLIHSKTINGFAELYIFTVYIYIYIHTHTHTHIQAHVMLRFALLHCTALPYVIIMYICINIVYFMLCFELHV